MGINFKLVQTPSLHSAFTRKYKRLPQQKSVSSERQKQVITPQRLQQLKNWGYKLVNRK